MKPAARITDKHVCAMASGLLHHLGFEAMAVIQPPADPSRPVAALPFKSFGPVHEAVPATMVTHALRASGFPLAAAS